MPESMQKRYTYFKNNLGEPLAYGKVYFYKTNTFEPEDTYSDYSLTTLNDNPVILDSEGKAEIRLQLYKNYRVILKDSNDKLVYSADNIFGGGTGISAPSSLTSNLDVGVYSIVSNSNGNIIFNPAATGYTELKSLTLQNNLDASSVNIAGVDFGDSTSTNVLSVNNTQTAVNYFTITNAATGSDPKISASGSDANISIALRFYGNPGSPSPGAVWDPIKISASNYKDNISDDNDIVNLDYLYTNHVFDSSAVHTFGFSSTFGSNNFKAATVTISGGTPSLVRTAVGSYDSVIDSGVGYFKFTPVPSLNVKRCTAAASGSVPLCATIFQGAGGTNNTSVSIYSDLNPGTKADPTSVSITIHGY